MSSCDCTDFKGWLETEIFNGSIPTGAVERLEKWRGSVESCINSYFDTDYGDGPASWRQWNRCKDMVDDEFWVEVENIKAGKGAILELPGIITKKV